MPIAFKKFVTMVLVVEGRRSFPIDMLRYDSAVPATEEDAHKIERLMDMAVAHETTQVRLRRFAREDDRRCHRAEERWASYGWEVVTYDLEN